MTSNNEDDEAPIRSSIEGLEQAADTAHDEIDDVGETIAAAVDEVAKITDSALPQSEKAVFESALRDITGGMHQGAEHLKDEVLSAITSEITSLEALLHRDADAGSTPEIPISYVLHQSEGFDQPDNLGQPDGIDQPEQLGELRALQEQEAREQLEGLDPPEVVHLELPDGTVLTLGAPVPDPLGWTPTQPADEGNVPEEEDTRSKGDRIAAILLRDGNSLGKGIEKTLGVDQALLEVTDDEHAEADHLAPSPGTAVVATAAVLAKFIGNVVDRHKKSRQQDLEQEEE